MATIQAVPECRFQSEEITHAARWETIRRRPAGSATRKTLEIADRAAAAGELPYEFLLRVVRGEVVDGTVPTFAERLDAAKAAATYFAPKLAAVAMAHDVSDPLANLLQASDGRCRRIPGVTIY